jgi:hypothetical protein
MVGRSLDDVDGGAERELDRAKHQELFIDEQPPYRCPHNDPY